MTEIRRNRVRTRIDDSTMPGRALHRPPAAAGSLPAPAILSFPATLVTPAGPVDPGPAPGSDQALHVLAMAQRTADDHLQAVYQAAETMKAEAQAAAEQIRRDAEAAREEIRAQADQLLAVARETVEQELREARAQAEALQREARQALDEARERADRTDAAAKTAAEDLRRAAQFKYDHVVGGLESTRESYQRQIEALAQFDHEYRARLSSFMQGQLRALWTDQPHIDDKQLTGPRKTRASFGQAA